MPSNNKSAITNRPHKSKRLRILISAYACEPGKGSEPAVGWNIALEMAKLHDVWVLTRSNNREVIEAEMSKHPVDDVTFFYHDLPKWARWWKKGGRGVQLYYYLWQLTAVSKIREKHAEVEFDLCHHVTFVKYWVPSCLAWLKIPFVWGPVGGGDSSPISFLKDSSWKGIVYEIGRDCNRWFSFFDPFVRLTVRNSAVCIVVTRKTNSCVKRFRSDLKTDVITQVGMSEKDLVDIERISPKQGYGKDCVFLFAGNLLFLKGVHLGLRAFARGCFSTSRFVIIGEGPQRGWLESLASDLGIADRVKFLGPMQRKETIAFMKSADVLVHPSLHDSGGFVPIEAMACGKPVICLNLAGPAVVVSNETGIRIEATDPVETVSALSHAMQRMVDDPILRERMGAAGRRRVEQEFLWSKKVEAFSRLYYEIIESKAEG